MSFFKKLFGFDDKQKNEELNKDLEKESFEIDKEGTEQTIEEAYVEALEEDELFQKRKDEEDIAKYNEVKKMALEKKYEEEIINNSDEVLETLEIEDEDKAEEVVDEKILKEIPEVDDSLDFENVVNGVKERLEKLDMNNTKEPDNLIDLEDHTKDEHMYDLEVPEDTEEVIVFSNDNITEAVILEESNEIGRAKHEVYDDELEDSEDEEIEDREEEAEEIVQPMEDSASETLEEKEENLSFFAKLKKGLTKTKDAIFAGIEDVLSNFTVIDEELFEELEESLIMADMGVDTSLFIIDKLRKEVKKEGVTDVNEIRSILENIIADILSKDVEPLVYNSPTVVLVIGVNGAGKTTTIGKLTHKLKSEGKNVLLAAADTFRAAAIDQLEVWSKRNEVDLIKHQENSDPAAVVYDACKAAKARKTDVLIVDTAGRLQNKKNLMEELKKIRRIIDSEYADAQLEVFLVLDGTTGQNAVSQAKIFNEVVNVTGLVITKLDGTAKGGIVVSIFNEMNLPVRYVGLGEKINDLEEFNSKDFAKALFE